MPSPHSQGSTGAKVVSDGPSGTEERVCQDIAKRQRLGMSKYGTTVEQNLTSRRETLQHAYEEALDLAIYLKRSIELFDAESADKATWKESGRVMREQRRIRKLTLVDVASQLNVSVEQVSKMERGEVCPLPVNWPIQAQEDAGRTVTWGELKNVIESAIEKRELWNDDDGSVNAGADLDSLANEIAEVLLASQDGTQARRPPE